MKKIIAILLSIVMLTALVACGSKNSSGTKSESTAKSKPIILGAIAPLTGDAAYLGEQLKNICKYLEHEVNAEGGVNGRKIQFVFEDDQGTTAGAATAVSKLIDADHVNAIIGPLFTSCILGMKDYVLNAQIPTMIATSANPDIFGKGHEGNYLFTLDSTPDLVAENEITYWVKDKGFKKIALYGLQNDQTITKNKYYNKLAKEMGAEIVYEATFNAGTDDHRSALTAIKASGAEIVMFNCDTADLVKLCRQIKELGLDNIYISTDYQAIKEDVLEKIKNIVDGRLSYACTGLPINEEAQKRYDEFVKKYLEFTGKNNVDPFEAILYDCGRILIKAMRESGATTGPVLRDYLANNIVGYSGVTGLTTLTDNGLASRSSLIMEYKDGQTSIVRIAGAE